MSYTINKTDGNVLVTLLDGTTNTDTGLTLIGRNYTGYGDAQNENFVRLLENFSSNLPPGESVGFAPIAGQLWYDSANKKLKVYNGLNFVTVSERNVSSTAPTVGIKTGDQWWDTSTKQLKTYDGSDWQLIGPAYSSSQGLSGAVVEAITDTNSVSHTVVNNYTNGNLISITSYGTTFTPQTTIPGFTTISAGVNLRSGTNLNGTASNSNTVGNIASTSFARVDANSEFTQDVSIDGRLTLTDASVYFANKSLIVQNTNLSGNVELYVNTTLGNTRALFVDGATGAVAVSTAPTNPLHVVNKQYVDDFSFYMESNITAASAQLTANTIQLRYDTDANLLASVTSTNANLIATRNSINANVQTLSDNTYNTFLSVSANAAFQQTQINFINNELPFLAPLASPALTGSPTAPTASLNTNSTVIATTQYVDRVGTTITDKLASTDANVASTINRINAANVVISNVDSAWRANAVSQQISLGTLNSLVEQLAVQAGVLAGSIDATNQAIIANTQTLNSTITNQVTTLSVTTNQAIQANVSPLAPINSPAFAGTPTAPTPSLSDNSTKLATTAFVTGAIANQAKQFVYTVSTLPPSGGNNGDFWFQIG
ncbi:hypothetical protein UFOVP112_117 [uncultured Caudovirales phage]|uniref:Uncharacterized protein n=1 Tax=uncultured Caudovirales phage TaxID=2100421 RepID=A0A6J5L2K8_9CAUD|nr:hypothetical protein UFOVP112_117 [uncultured Caudovirales phage]